MAMHRPGRRHRACSARRTGNIYQCVQRPQWPIRWMTSASSTNCRIVFQFDLGR